ncbi:SGNH/GDSL hydrolase family protein [Microbacterium radiodurans]|uniref:SGNH/GDSL hydrolase family protein n=1 Tax=Microbacterium radiodurans TaxID=661398 RepID=UPI001CC5D0E9|nr:SGNH/GDSL hydrolase family protein [Microbacterium radiodurans]
MRARPTPSRRRTSWAVAAVAVAAIAVVAAVAWRPWASPVEPAAPVAAGDDAVTAPASLVLPQNPTVLIFGDSWTYGSAASDPALGYAYVIAEEAGWTTVVDGVRGSGYLKPGIDGPSFGDRIAALDPAVAPDLVIVQGSINDRKQGASGYAEAVDAAWDDLARIYPGAQIVVLGPAPQVLPVEAETARIDRDLRERAGVRGWWYISPIADDWITPGNYLDVIDTSEIGRDHPSTGGHRYLAQRLADAVSAITAPPVVAADVAADPLGR